MSHLFRFSQRCIPQQSLTISAAALHDRPGDPVLRQRRRDQPLYAHCSRRLAKYRDVLRISAESSNILLNPFQRRNLIQHSVIAADTIGIFFAQPLVRQIPEHAHPVIDCYQNDSSLSVLYAIEFHLMSETVVKGASMNPESHRKLLICRRRRPPYVQIQTVFIKIRQEIPLVIKLNIIEGALLLPRLPACFLKMIRMLHALPGHTFLRRAKSPLPCRRCRIGNAQKYFVSVFLYSL